MKFEILKNSSYFLKSKYQPSLVKNLPVVPNSLDATSRTLCAMRK